MRGAATQDIMPYIMDGPDPRDRRATAPEVEAAPDHVQPFHGSGIFDLEIIIDRSTMLDTVQGDLSRFAINPQEDAIVTDTVF